jgi:hypothetical protein
LKLAVNASYQEAGRFSFFFKGMMVMSQTMSLVKHRCFRRSWGGGDGDCGYGFSNKLCRCIGGTSAVAVLL